MSRPLYLETVSPAKWNKCACCSEQIRPCESRLSVMREGRKTPVETYCPSCESYAVQNNPSLGQPAGWQDDAENRSERMREHFASHAAAGVARETAWLNWDYSR
jgi:hypothetical protein